MLQSFCQTWDDGMNKDVKAMNANVAGKNWGGGRHKHVSVIAQSTNARQENNTKMNPGEKRGGGEVNVKGNAINGFVRSLWLKDGWPQINEQVNESTRECERRVPLS